MFRNPAACALLGAVAVLTGCGVEVMTTTAIQGELQAQQMTALRGQIQGAANQTGRINIERAIKTYQAENGAYPPSLEALTPQYLPSVPLKADGTPYGYNPATGQLLDAPAAGPPAQDLGMLAQIEQAVARYGEETGYYPATLDQLYPGYLPMPPRTAAGEEFLYDNQTGAVRHPHAPALPAAGGRRGAPVAAGTGPMGEVMTGMAVQQELNAMGQSGANAAGGYARQSVRGISDDRTQQQNATMDELGL